MPSISEHYEKGWQAIVKPLRIQYSMNDLGPAKMNVGGSMVIRTDFTLTNKRGSKLACSFFEHTTSQIPLPTVVYCHANGSCRIEAMQYKQMILSSKFHYFCFDFTACGSSEGEYGSIGHYEQEDLDAVLKHIQESGKASKVALWGRSMGAVTSIMYCAKNPFVSCMVLDSPYATFKRLVYELAKNRGNVPRFLTSVVLGMLRKTVKKKAKFDVYDLTPIEYVGRLEIPALFGAPKDDTFVSPQHTKDLYMTHNGPKQLGIFEGDHNSQRPLEWIQRVVEFLKQQLKEEEKKIEHYGYVPQQQQTMQAQHMQTSERHSHYNQGNSYGHSQPRQEHYVQSQVNNYGHAQQDHYGQNQANGYGHREQDNYGHKQDHYGHNQDSYGHRQVNSYGHREQDHYGQNQGNGYGHREQDHYGHNQGSYGQSQQDHYGQSQVFRSSQVSQVNTYGYNNQNNNYGTSQESNYGYHNSQSYGYNSGQNFVPVDTESRLVRPAEPGYPGRI